MAVALDKVTSWMGEHEIDLGDAGGRSLIDAVKAHGQVRRVSSRCTGWDRRTRSVREPLREAGIPLLHGLRPALVALRRAGTGTALAAANARRRAAPTRAPRSTLDEPGPVLSEACEPRGSLRRTAFRWSPATWRPRPTRPWRSRRGWAIPVVMKADVARRGAQVGRRHRGRRRGRRTTRCADVRPADGARRRERHAGAGRAGRGDGVGSRGHLRHAARPGVRPGRALGLGGTLTEVLKDVPCAWCRPSVEDLDEMLEECAVGRLLARTGADPAALRTTVRGARRGWRWSIPRSRRST